MKLSINNPSFHLPRPTASLGLTARTMDFLMLRNTLRMVHLERALPTASIPCLDLFRTLRISSPQVSHLTRPCVSLSTIACFATCL
jgi:hypothetical protein